MKRFAFSVERMAMSESATDLSPWHMVDTLLALDDEEALETALSSAPTAAVARAVALAPTLEQKTTILWAMEDRQRRDTLELLPAPLIGVLIQNLEDDNRYLLGDLSLEQFRNLLSLCSPERKYYWVVTALSFTDVRANALPLLLPTSELVDILLTRSEFEAHLRAIGDFPLEDARLPPDLMTDPAQTLVDLLGAENFLRQFPIADTTLAGFLQTVLDYDPDRYVDLIREGLRVADYSENHPLEWETLVEEPVLLDAPPQVQAPEVEGPEPEELGESPAAASDEPPLALMPVTAPPLARLTASLSSVVRDRVFGELQRLFVRQAVAEGGSFLLSDLARIARSVEAYLLLGLQAETGGNPDAEAQTLEHRSLNKISQNGARVLEGLRQVAYRLQPHAEILSTEQRSLLRSFVQPRMTLSAEGEPRIALLPGAALSEEVDIRTATGLLQRVSAWVQIARALGLEEVKEAMRRTGTGATLPESLALGAVLYNRLEIGLAEPADEPTLARRYLSDTDELAPEASQNLRRVVDAWSRGRGLDAGQVYPVFEEALLRLVNRLRQPA